MSFGNHKESLVQLKRALFNFVLVVACCAATFAADTYTIDPVHSSVAFSVQHLVISRVSGNFLDFSGTIVYEEKDPSKSSVEVHIKTASVDTRNQKRDEDLRSDEFFNAAKFPEITFVSNRIEKTGDGYIAHGPLTIHGVSKDIALPFSISGTIKDPWGNTRLGAQGGLTINRKDFGLSYSKTIESGGLMVGDEVKIELAVEAVKK
jgi:polyisoprenoid-binding protein YceI